MKNNDKKVNDAPLRLYLEPKSSICYEGLKYIHGHHLDKRYWTGWAEPQWENLEGYDEYISLNKAWHDAREVPVDLHASIIAVQKDFSSPDIINLHTRCLHGILDDWTDKEKWKQIILDRGTKKRLPFAYWAYIKDLVPTKEKGDTK